VVKQHKAAGCVMTFRCIAMAGHTQTVDVLQRTHRGPRCTSAAAHQPSCSQHANTQSFNCQDVVVLGKQNQGCAPFSRVRSFPERTNNALSSQRGTWAQTPKHNTYSAQACISLYTSHAPSGSHNHSV